MLSVKQVAEKAGVSLALVYGWISSGLLTHYRLGAKGRRGAIRIAESDLESFLRSFKQEGQARTPTLLPRPKVKLQHLQLPS